jgi:hypothetical protein
VLELRREVWKRAREDAHKFILQAQARWVQSKKEGRMFKEGDQVWLEGRNLHLDQPSAKLAPKTSWTLHYQTSPIPYHVSAGASPSMEDTRRVPCGSLNPVC